MVNRVLVKMDALFKRKYQGGTPHHQLGQLDFSYASSRSGNHAITNKRISLSCMKYAKSFFLAFLLAAVTGYLSYAALGSSLPNLVQTGIEKYTQSKTAAKSFPISIYLLLMASALTELLVSFKVSAKLIELARDKALGRVLKVGGALIGVIAGMTTAFYQAGNSTDVKVGLGLILMVATFLIEPILIATSLRLLTENDASPGRANLLRWTIRICCSAILLIATYGIVDEITKKVGSANGQASARAIVSQTGDERHRGNRASRRAALAKQVLPLWAEAV